jgi:hypothetical protein
VSLPRDQFVATIRESNRQGRDAWTRFADHRDRVTGMLTAAPGNSLCVLGAGNLNDLDLDRLLGVFPELHLVDLDVDAVRAGLARRRRPGTEAIRVHGPVDLSGILDRLPTGASGDDAADGLLRVLARHRCVVPGHPFGVTASVGMLTQLLQSVVDSSLASPDVVAVSLALRDKHLADLLHLTRPGGMVVLVTDVVSTTTAPGLHRSSPAGLEEQMARLVASRNFFTGTNPYRIIELLESDARFRDLVTDVRLLDPWLWAVTTDRQHLTCAIVARRSTAPMASGIPAGSCCGKAQPRRLPQLPAIGTGRSCET